MPGRRVSSERTGGTVATDCGGHDALSRRDATPQAPYSPSAPLDPMDDIEGDPPRNVSSRRGDDERGRARDLPELLAEHYRFVRLFVRLRLDQRARQRESATDIVQSVCREVLERADRFEYQGRAAFRSWLCEAALRKLRDRWKYHHAERRDPAREAALVDDEGRMCELADAYRTTLDPVGRVLRAEDIERLEASFDELSDAQREVMALRFVAGLDYAEIAARTGRNTAAVRKLAQRARIQIASRLANE